MRPILLKGHERSITDIRYNTEGDLLFTTSKSYQPTVWWSDSGERIGTYNGHNGAVWMCDVTRDSKYLLTGSADNTAKIWDVETGKDLATLKHKAPVRCVAWSQGEHRFLTVTDAVMGYLPTIHIYPTAGDMSEQTTTPLKTWQNTKMKMLHAVWTNLNQHLYTANEDGSIRVFDVETGKQIAQSTVHRGSVSRINFDKHHSTFVSSSKDGTAKLFDVKSLKVLKTYDTGRPINCAVQSPIKDHVFLAGGEGAETVTTTRLDITQFKVRIFHKVYENEVGSMMGHFGTVNVLAISPDGKSFASGAEDGYVRLHHLEKDYLEMSDK